MRRSLVPAVLMFLSILLMGSAWLISHRTVLRQRAIVGQQRVLIEELLEELEHTSQGLAYPCAVGQLAVCEATHVWAPIEIYEPELVEDNE